MLPLETRENAWHEIKSTLDNEIMTHEQLLLSLLWAMDTKELQENWDFIKQTWELKFDENDD